MSAAAMKKQTDGQTDGRTDGRTDGSTDGRTDRRGTTDRIDEGGQAGEHARNHPLRRRLRRRPQRGRHGDSSALLLPQARDLQGGRNDEGAGVKVDETKRWGRKDTDGSTDGRTDRRGMTGRIDEGGQTGEHAEQEIRVTWYCRLDVNRSRVVRGRRRGRRRAIEPDGGNRTPCVP